MITHEIIAAIILPVPVFHLWLHALLPTWRKHPFVLYLFGLALWVGAFYLIPVLDGISPQAFNPTNTSTIIGAGLIVVGFLAALWSLLTLGPIRFFVWAALRPSPALAVRIISGPFRFLPHPAYLGYVVVALGNLLWTGKLYLAGILTFLIILTPLVIWFEEHELAARIKS